MQSIPNNQTKPQLKRNRRASEPRGSRHRTVPLDPPGPDPDRCLTAGQ